MDALNTALGLSHARPVQPKSLAAWNAQYEALSLENDWWFEAAVAVIGQVRALAKSIARATAPAPQLAHA